MVKSKSFVYGVIIGIIGIVLFSSKAVMVKLAYNYKVDPVSMLLLRMAFSFPFYVIIALFWKTSKQNTSFKKVDVFWIVFFGFVGYYLASLFDFIGLEYIKASLERVILFIYPTIVLLLNRIFFKKRITKKQLFAIALTYIGIVITFSRELSISGNNTYIGGFFVILSAITYASYLVGSGWLIPKFGVLKFTSYAMLVSCLCVFVHYAFVFETNIFALEWQVYILGALIAIFATVIPSFLVSESIKIINASNFAIVAGIGPISTIVLAMIFLNESLTGLQIIGTLLVIFGIFLVSKTKK